MFKIFLPLHQLLAFCLLIAGIVARQNIYAAAEREIPIKHINDLQGCIDRLQNDIDLPWMTEEEIDMSIEKILQLARLCFLDELTILKKLRKNIEPSLSKYKPLSEKERDYKLLAIGAGFVLLGAGFTALTYFIHKRYKVEWKKFYEICDSINKRGYSAIGFPYSKAISVVSFFGPLDDIKKEFEPQLQKLLLDGEPSKLFAAVLGTAISWFCSISFIYQGLHPGIYYEKFCLLKNKLDKIISDHLVTPVSALGNDCD